MLALIENHMRFADAQRMKASTLKRFFRLERFDEHLALHRMDCLAASGNLEHWEFVRERFSSMPAEAVRPQPLITGRELIAAGYAPGARFREMLRVAEDAQLEGTIATAEEALQAGARAISFLNEFGILLIQILCRREVIDETRWLDVPCGRPLLRSDVSRGWADDPRGDY